MSIQTTLLGTVLLASFPGPAQLSVAISTVLQATKSWAGPGNEATVLQDRRKQFTIIQQLSMSSSSSDITVLQEI